MIGKGYPKELWVAPNPRRIETGAETSSMTPHPQHSKILNQCPLLRTLLGDRSQRCLAWPHRSRAQFAFLEADFLLEQLRATSVVGVEKLAADGTASILKFESTLSEFRFALLFSL